ncbi:MAG: geranylgeranyl reductase family protein [Candidatus Heimdallarchaeota archaeon]
MTSKQYDVIIIGAGTAGCLAAHTAVTSGLEKVAIIDRKPEKLIGNKICGDGIGINHLENLQKLGFPIKEDNIIANQIQTARLISPDKEKEFTLPIQGKLAIINRYTFGQTLLKEAVNEGAQLFDDCMFKTFEYENNQTKVTMVDKKGKASTIIAPLIIDSSGINSRIREEMGIFDDYAKLRDDEQYYCYREVTKIPNPSDTYTDSAIFEFNYKLTRGGYIWFFDRGNNEFNMGTGIPKSWIKQFSPKDIYFKHMHNRFSKIETLDSGGGFVPTRHPIPSHVKNNIILTGDAGLIVNPLHGGGLSPSLTTGYFAGKLAAELVPNEKLTEEDLWSYNTQIMQRYGLRYSLLDLYRILLQNIPDDELSKAFLEEYLPLGMIFYAREYDLLLSLSRELGQVWKEVPNKRFQLLAQAIEDVNNINSIYPETPDGIKNWAKRYSKIYDDYQTAIKL